MKAGEVIIYVEGPSDQAAMQALLIPLLQKKLRESLPISFSRALRGDRKKYILHKGSADDPCVRERFRVFCFKHDLEALILASEEALRKHFGIDRLKVTWRIPVEDQDHSNPPRQIVERLFREHGQTYKTMEHAPLILGASDYRDIADKCPQCFKPFVEFLSSLEPAEYHS